MSNGQKRIVLLDVVLMSFIPLLYLYNQNSNLLYFPQIVVAGALLACFTAGLFLLFYAAFRTYTGPFFACVVFIALVFFIGNIFGSLSQFWERLIFVLPIPLAYIAGYLYYRIFHKKEWKSLPVIATVAFATLLLFNIVPLLTKGGDMNLEDTVKYKTEFVVNDASQTPNVYWFFCDGMLGFDAMEQYFNDPQEALQDELTKRGFEIDRSAEFEAGHWSRIAIPALMCPDYYDTYMQKLMADHDAAVALRKMTGTGLDNARKNNETILAFDAKGYTTVTISIPGPYFYPMTDYYYYIKSRSEYAKDEVTVPRKTENIDTNVQTVDEHRLYAYQLGEIFLGGIPGQVYDLLFPSKTELERALTTDFDGVSEALCGTQDALINTALVTSLYDAVNAPEIRAPKFVIIHDFLAHYPFDTDENGNREEQYENILSYRGHHTYAAKVLLHLIDLVLEADPSAVIIIEGDHGLHEMTQDQITEAFGADAALDIWNSVISAIRVPGEYQNGDEKFALSNPLNISRYIVNNFVGENYAYIAD